MTYTYRAATLDDAEILRNLLHASYAENLQYGVHFDATTVTLQQVQAHLIYNLCYFLEDDGVVLSTVSLRMPWGPNPGPCPVPHIGWFASLPNSGKKGIGSALLEWLETTILKEQLKVPYVTLGTADSHPWLGTMYEKKGYVKFGQKDLGKGHLTNYYKKNILEA
ncbi:GNAT family N-acetyltransferase [Lysinibacillus sp. FSL K6-0232]|uniref:GNAT family N-acetyltransferase n=1 Tax=unclassified Lysinibacillus TaxID=2636778 RepID=UPI0030F7B89D